MKQTAEPVAMQPSLAGKTIVVIGGSSGLGLATAKAADAEGATVIIVSGNRQRLDQALGQLSDRSSALVVDVSNEAAIRACFEKLGAFDHLVYTAGENISLGMLSDTELEKARDFFTIRYWGAVAAVKYAMPHLRTGGSISLTSGIASLRPGKGWSQAAAICGAMEGFVRAMAVELAPIRVNAVMPGVVRTNLWNSMPEAERENLYSSVGKALPVGRVGVAEDIALSFLYLMKQTFGTGQCLVADGGTVLV